jgi:sugar diacid utilization regulator
VPARTAGGPGFARDRRSALSRLLALSACADDYASIARTVACAVDAIGPCRAEGILLDGRWQDIGVRHREPGHDGLGRIVPAADSRRVDLAGVPWAWAYPMPEPGLAAGCLVVGAACEPAADEVLLLQILAQQATAALAAARLRGRAEQQAAELQRAEAALRRRMQVHDRLTQVAQRSEGQDGIARAVYELTGLPAGIEDRSGHLRAWAGPGRPDPYPEADPRRRDALLRRAMAARAPVRDGDRLISAALLAGDPVIVLAVSDPGGAAGDMERVAIEHATTVLGMEVARLQGLAETGTHLRSKLVLDLIAGADEPGVLSRAQALGYDLGRRHRVIAVEGRRGGNIDAFFRAVSRAAADGQVGSLLAVHLRDVIVLADSERPWEQFRAAVVANLHGARCRIGVGGCCEDLGEFPRSYREARLALRIQKAVRGHDQTTQFEQLGVYQVLGNARETAAMEGFVRQQLGALIDYDALHGAQLVETLSEYLECGGNYDASASGLSVHRSTLKYRLKRIREVSGHDLRLPDTQFNLQLATRAARTLLALRDS